MAGLGIALPAQAVRPARAHPARAPRRDPRRDPPRTLKRPPRRPQLQDPPDQPPRLRLPQPRPPHRPCLPLLQRPHHRAPTMNFTPNSDQAPEFDRIAREILAETMVTDGAEDELYGEARGDELPERLRTPEGRREFFRRAKQQLPGRAEGRGADRGA